jgi:hypothetical protein
MPAYLIYFCHEYCDRKGHFDYVEAFPKTVQGIDYKVLAAYTDFEVLEGHEPVKGAVLLASRARRHAQVDISKTKCNLLR